MFRRGSIIFHSYVQGGHDVFVLIGRGSKRFVFHYDESCFMMNYCFHYYVNWGSIFWLAVRDRLLITPYRGWLVVRKLLSKSL